MTGIRTSGSLAAHHPTYDHTQTGPICWLLLLPNFLLLPVVFVLSRNPGGMLVILGVDAILIGAALSFRSLRVVDENQSLACRFGPLPFFSKRIAYADMISADRDRTALIDGWGIHWLPGRGWTYNLWGRDCVRLKLKSGQTVRIGTDDPTGLENFLRDRISHSAAGQESPLQSS